MKNKSVWRDLEKPSLTRLDKSAKYDTIVIGAGITGLTAAYLLAKEGQKVCVLDRGVAGGVDTSNTTAHLTYVTDIRLSELIKNFGKGVALKVWQAGVDAIETIRKISQTGDIDCEFQRVPGFLHAPLFNGKSEAEKFEEEALLALELGFDAEYVPVVPYFKKPGIRFSNQAFFHPLKYTSGLIKKIIEMDGEVYEHTEAEEFDTGSLQLKVGSHRIEASYVVISTHTPLTGTSGIIKAAFLQTKLALYTSYALGAALPRATIPAASFWDTSDPYYYLRVERKDGYDYAIFGGMDHKTGQEDDTEKVFANLEKRFKEIFPAAKIDHSWSGQVIKTNDGLPFIGENEKAQFIATGFSGNGMTFGTLAGLMARDAATGKINPYTDIFAPRRNKLIGGTLDYLRENIDYPYYMIKDRFSSHQGTPDNVEAGEGKILRVNGKTTACYRDREGKLTCLSALCSHMGCTVAWNSAEKTWDCPCHGSRFLATGEVLSGPAESPLKVIAQNLGPAR